MDVRGSVFSMVASKSMKCSGVRMTPSPSMIAEMPVFTARTSGVLVSIARNFEVMRC